MSKVFISELDSAFAKALAALFEQNGFTVVTDPGEAVEYFIDTTETHVEGDDKKLGEGLDQDVLVKSYDELVCKPLARLEKAFHQMTGKKRICFISTKNASVNQSESQCGFGYNMAKAVMHQIMMITKNTYVKEEDGYSFRLFDPMTGEYPAEKAAAAAYVYFTRDRYYDEDDHNTSRYDEWILMLRDALGREIPW